MSSARKILGECAYAGEHAGPAILSEDRAKTIPEDQLHGQHRHHPDDRPRDLYGVEEIWTDPNHGRRLRGLRSAQKRKDADADAGFDASDLLMTVALQPNGEGHRAVLTVRTDRGDYILDNMRNKVKPWTDTEYTYLKRQSADDPARWVGHGVLPRC